MPAIACLCLALLGLCPQVRILMVGLDASGKTSILYRLQVRLRHDSRENGGRLEPSLVRWALLA